MVVKPSKCSLSIIFFQNSSLLTPSYSDPDRARDGYRPDPTKPLHDKRWREIFLREQEGFETLLESCYRCGFFHSDGESVPEARRSV